MLLCLKNFAADWISQTHTAFLFAGFILDLARTTALKKILQAKLWWKDVTDSYLKGMMRGLPKSRGSVEPSYVIMVKLYIYDYV